MKDLFLALKTYAFGHRKTVSFLVIGALLVSYWMYSANNPTTAQAKYVFGTVERGTLVSSLTGSGQVSVTQQRDIKAKSSGDVIYVGTTVGAEVKAGALLAIVDTTDAEKAVRDAQIALDKAALAFQKFKGGNTDAGALRGTKDKAVDDLKKMYDATISDIASAFTDLPEVLAGLNGIIFSTTLSGAGQWNYNYYADTVRQFDVNSEAYRLSVYSSYAAAKTAYDKNFKDYQAASINSDQATLDTLAAETYATAKTLATAIKNTVALIQFYQDKIQEHDTKPVALSYTDLSSLDSYTSKIAGTLASLSGDINAIQAGKEAITNAVLDISSQAVAVEQAENNLADAKTALADCYVRAPFDGVVASVPVKKGDAASSGTTIATMITKQKLAEISLNEIDIVKVKAGEKVTLTFDAIEGLTIAGHVSETDVAGTVSQGVVNYAVKIAFDTDDARVRPGMSVSAAIITDIRPDVLMIQNSAIKSQNGTKYVEVYSGTIPDGTANALGVLLPAAPTRQMIETGAANDTTTEITSGLNEGDQVIIRTITSTAKTAATQTAAFGVSGGARAGGNATFNTGTAVRISR